jgi:mono/diheme cytochrome c family protein
MPGRLSRLLLKITAYGFGALLLLVAAAVTLTVGWRPVVGARARPLDGSRRFEPSPARLARGKYLAEAVSGCFDCHTRFDPDSNPPVRLSQPGAGSLFINDGALQVVAPNITPDRETGAGAWSDDALARAIREGIGHDGRALFPAMPYPNFRKMSDEDVASVVVYLRSVEPARAEGLPPTRIPFPLSRLILNAPQPLAAPVSPPDLSTQEKRGEYLTTIANCRDCHTPMRRGEYLEGLEMAGGSTIPGGERAVSANLTPDPSGIPYYDERLFLEAMRTGRVRARHLTRFMPWWSYRYMTDEDLKAVFAHLRTLKPVKHHVDNAEPPTPCKLCGNRHGLGEKN